MHDLARMKHVEELEVGQGGAGRGGAGRGRESGQGMHGAQCVLSLLDSGTFNTVVSSLFVVAEFRAYSKES